MKQTDRKKIELCTNTPKVVRLLFFPLLFCVKRPIYVRTMCELVNVAPDKNTHRILCVYCTKLYILQLYNGGLCKSHANAINGDRYR